jgi:hypothetical protein
MKYDQKPEEMSDDGAVDNIVALLSEAGSKFLIYCDAVPGLTIEIDDDQIIVKRHGARAALVAADCRAILSAPLFDYR